MQVLLTTLLLTLYYSITKSRDYTSYLNSEDFENVDILPVIKYLITLVSARSKHSKGVKFSKDLKTVATQLKVVTSNMAFKINQRYTSYVLSENKVYVFVTCRELTQVPSKNKTVLKRVKRPLKELFLKCLFGGLNAYRYEDGINNLHIFSIRPFVLQYYQQLYKFIKLFLHYE